MIASIQPQYLSTEDSAKPSFARAMRYECWRLALNVSSVSHQFGGAGGADDAAGAGGAGRRRGCQELASVPGFGPITLKAAGTALHRCPEVHDVATSAAAPAHHEQGDEQPFRLAGEMPKERDEPGRRLRVLRRVGRPQQCFEQSKHDSVASRRLAARISLVRKAVQGGGLRHFLDTKPPVSQGALS